MQVRMIIKLLLVPMVIGSAVSCSAVQTIIADPYNIQYLFSDRIAFKHAMRMNEAHRYHLFIDKMKVRYQTEDSYFCIYDLDFKRGVFVRFAGDDMIIDTYRNRHKKEERIVLSGNPFSALSDDEIKVIKEEMEDKFPWFLDGRELYLAIYWPSKKGNDEWTFESTQVLLSAVFETRFLIELQKIIADYRITEILYD